MLAQMTNKDQIFGRDTQVRNLKQLIDTKINNKQSCLIYVTGAPGTGKSMTVRYLMDHFKSASPLYLNCANALKPKDILLSLCEEYDLGKFKKSSECDMIERLARKFSGRSAKSYLIVLDEIDHLSQTKNKNVLKDILRWPSQPHSRLILVAIANTTTLTTKIETINQILDKDPDQITKIIFTPYSRNDLKQILQWYVDNDEFFHGHEVLPDAIHRIAQQFCNNEGDVRAAINGLKTSVQDMISQEKEQQLKLQKESKLDQEPELLDSLYPTPPSTPPIKTRLRLGMSSVVTSIKKKTSRKTLCRSDEMPYEHQIILTCIDKLCSVEGSVSLSKCMKLITSVLAKGHFKSNTTDIRAIIENFCLLGFIEMKKSKLQTSITILTSKTQINNVIPQRGEILELMKL